MIYPCKECLVQAACSDKCIEYLAFINGAADNLGDMSADELSYIIMEVPLEIRRKIHKFVSEKLRYATERGMEIHDFREKELTECPSDTLVRLA